MKQIFIIEHLEPEVYPWVVMEYKHISQNVGKSNLWFTNTSSNKLKPYGNVIKHSVKDAILQDACILDPESPNLLTPEEAKKYTYFIFGGILGDYPPRKRTEDELTNFLPNIPSYNIGKEQMSTDNAVAVVKEITKGTPMNKMKFQDTLTIRINDIESIELPYRYLIKNNKPYVSNEVINYLKRKKGF